MNIYFAIVGSLILAFAGGYCACELIHRLRQKPEAPTEIHPAAVEAAQEAVQAEAFAVAGKPKRPPFRERKKELKAGARTKRQKLEEWRD